MDYMKTYVDEFLISPQTQDFFFNSSNLLGVGQHVSSIFWSRWFWLPSHLTWEDLRSRTDVKYADPTEIWTYPIAMALLFLFLRAYVLNPYIFGPIAKYMGVKPKIIKVPVYNSKLENVFKRYGVKVPEQTVESLTKETQFTKGEIEHWMRRRRASERPSKYMRFQEVSYIATYHIGVTLLCIFTLYDRPWAYDLSLCFKDHPHHSVDDRIWWLYMTALAFYWSMTIHQLASIRTTDTNMMILHHVCTIILMSFSWTGGFFRMGALVLLSHEPTDIPLLVAKLFIYAKLNAVTDILFGVFVIMWILQRLVYFPFWVLRECFFHLPAHLMAPVLYIQYGMGIILFGLNLAWTMMIFRILYNKVIKGDQVDDIRSSDEASDNEEANDKTKKNR